MASPLGLFALPLQLPPTDAAARGREALSLFQTGHLERALVIYEALLLDAPESSAVRVNLAVVLLKLGRASAARPLLESVVARSPGHRRGWGYLGVALEQLGLIAEAEEALLSGHHGAAATRLRRRHAGPSEALDPANIVSPLPADPSLDRAPTTMLEGDPAEISFEQSVPPRHALPPPSNAYPTRARSPGVAVAVPLLDAALSSLLVVPHRVSAVAHPGGFVVVRMLEGTDSREGGFAARGDVVHALSGPVRREVLGSSQNEPFRGRGAPFARWAGSGRLVLGPRGRIQLSPLHLDGDVAFVREELVAGFDQGLLCDASLVGLESGEPLALVRLRGDGVVVLGLERPLLALAIEVDEAMTVRADALVGWIGPLAVESTPDTHALATLLAVSGAGTVLLAGTATEASDSWE